MFFRMGTTEKTKERIRTRKQENSIRGMAYNSGENKMVSLVNPPFSLKE